MRTTTLGTPGASSDLPFHPSLRHPLTGAPLQAVGIGRRGPIWPVLGGAPDEGGGAGDSGSGADTTGGNDSGQQNDDATGGTDSGQGTGGTQNDDTDKTGDDKKPEPKEVKDFPAAAQKLIRDLRKEAGDNRAKATAAEEQTKKQLDAIAVALGLKKGEEVDPAKLQEQLTADVTKEKARGDAAEMKLAVFMAADEHGAKASELFDSASFLKDIGELDATDKDFASDLAELIKQRVKDNPTRYGRAPVKPAKSGSEHMNGGKPSERTGSLHAAVAKTMNRT